jgi:hypothetical protein
MFGLFGKHIDGPCGCRKRHCCVGGNWHLRVAAAFDDLAVLI